MASMMEKIGDKFNGNKKDDQHNAPHDTSGYGSNVAPGGHNTHGTTGYGSNVNPGGHNTHDTSGYGTTGHNVTPTTGQPQEKKHEGFMDKIKKKKNPNKVRKEGDKSSSSESD